MDKRQSNLTLRQRDVLWFLRRYIAENEIPPTYREIGEELGITRVSAHGHVLALEEKGYLEREALRSRNIYLTEGGEE